MYTKLLLILHLKTKNLFCLYTIIFPETSGKYLIYCYPQILCIFALTGCHTYNKKYFFNVAAWFCYFSRKWHGFSLSDNVAKLYPASFNSLIMPLSASSVFLLQLESCISITGSSYFL